MMINIDKDKLEKYYITENHTKEDTLKHFNISEDNLHYLCHSYDIVKHKSLKWYLEHISKEDLYNYYIKDNHSYYDAIEHFKICEPMFEKLLKQYNISKKHDLNYYTNKYPKEDLENYYIVENHSKEDTLKHFNIDDNFFGLLLNHYNIHKYKSTKNYGNDLSFTKEEFIDYYSNHTTGECINYFNISYGEFYFLLNKFNCHKYEPIESTLNRVSYEDFCKYYKDGNHNTQETMEHFDISVDIFYKLIKDFNLDYNINVYQTSSYETDIYELFKHLNPIQNDRKILDGKEIDLYFPEHKIGIEFNGTYWHSDKFQHKKYHEDKAKLAESKGIRLIQIWEYEWVDVNQREKIISLLKIALGETPSKIYARQCEIRKISNKEAKEFNNKNHLQNHRNAQVTYGLFYRDKLAQLMSFSKTKYNKNNKGDNDWEIIRGCPGSNNIVVGGVEKLFKHFIRDYSPTQIFSYCDFNKFDGKSYYNIGMEFLGYTGPDMKYVVKGEVINRNPKNYKFNRDNCDFKLYGAGSKKFVWRSSSER